MKGGKYINEGYRGHTYDLYNEEDNIDFYSKFKTDNPDYIILYALNRVFHINISDNEDKDEDENIYNEKMELILGLFRQKKNFIVKEFKRGNLLLGNGRYNFRCELKSIKKIAKIYGSKLDYYTTIKSIFKYKDIDIYGISYENKYYIFQEKCYKTLDKINFTQDEFNKFIAEIYESLLILQKNTFIHNDIKPENIIYCNNRYKLIDWDLSYSGYNHFIAFTKGSGGNFNFNHPVKFYNLGLSIFIYNFFYMFFKNYDYTSYEWLFNLKSYKLIEEKRMESLNLLIETNKTKHLSKYYDMYSFAMLIICLAEKNNLTYSKSFVNKLFAPFKITI